MNYDVYLFPLYFIGCQGAHGTAEAIEPLLAPSDDPPPFTLTVIDEGLV